MPGNAGLSTAEVLNLMYIRSTCYAKFGKMVKSILTNGGSVMLKHITVKKNTMKLPPCLTNTLPAPQSSA
jgi:hypothetical protein